jgi:hypothetical protein
MVGMEVVQEKLTQGKAEIPRSRKEMAMPEVRTDMRRKNEF